MSRIKMMNKAIRSAAIGIFHPRELHLHDAKGVRHIRIGVRTQLAAAAAALGFVGWTAVATASFVFGGPAAPSDAEIARQRQIAAIQADVAAMKLSADAAAKRLEARQQFLAGLLSGEKDPVQLAALLPETDREDASDQPSSPLAEIENKQLAFVDHATSTAEERYRNTQSLLKRIGLSPTRFTRQSRIAMGGPYEPVNAKDSDPAFQKLFASWTKLDTLETGMLSVPAMKPVRDFSYTSGFGVRHDPFNGGAAMHSGVDLAGRMGEPVYASADGIVEKAGWGGGYGNMVDLDHGRGIETRYGHLSSILVKEGQRVKRGDMIARMGSTGRSTGVHLHYEVRIDGRAVNPIPFLQSAEALAAVHSRALAGMGGPELPASAE